MAELDQLASPMVSCGAGFDADQAGRQLCEERNELRPSECLRTITTPLSSTPCTWNTDFAMSKPMVTT
jgi:hypothetical protein